MTNLSQVRIRLQRWGRLHKPFYRIVACPRKAPRDGKFHEILGSYNPIPDSHGNKQVTLKVERIKYWMMHGAEPSERVGKLLGIAEVLPPAPRRYLPKLSLGELFPAQGDSADEDEEAVSDSADEEEEGAGEADASGDADAHEEPDGSSSEATPEEKPP